MSKVKKIFKFWLIALFFLNSCVSLPGINKSPSKKKPNKKIIESEYSIKDVGINIVKINKLSETDIDFYNERKVEEAIERMYRSEQQDMFDDPDMNWSGLR